MKNLTILTLFLAMFCFASGCEKDDIKTTMDFDLNETVEIKYEEPAQLDTEDLEIKVVEVLDDSRCPYNALCTWAGQIKLKLKVTNKNVVTYEEIIFSQGPVQDVLIGAYLIQLTEVTPETDVNEEIELDDYIFTFVVTEQ